MTMDSDSGSLESDSGQRSLHMDKFRWMSLHDQWQGSNSRPLGIHMNMLVFIRLCVYRPLSVYMKPYNCTTYIHVYYIKMHALHTCNVCMHYMYIVQREQFF